MDNNNVILFDDKSSIFFLIINKLFGKSEKKTIFLTKLM